MKKEGAQNNAINSKKKKLTLHFLHLWWGEEGIKSAKSLYIYGLKIQSKLGFIDRGNTFYETNRLGKADKFFGT